MATWPTDSADVGSGYKCVWQQRVPVGLGSCEFTTTSGSSSHERAKCTYVRVLLQYTCTPPLFEVKHNGYVCPLHL